ncbi:MAG TPA: Gfo/Idh/MocA family oxidoreductase [Catalimonadaceae bacterium]|nr:Gfo/Idh/MocA family oxidoreductase [Catalimonadaceae bacterium]
MTQQDPVLVIGGGSIGERHIGNLLTLGYTDIVVLRSRNLPFRTVDASKVTIVTDWESALALKPIAAFICTPTSLHISQAIMCAENGISILAEKPLSHNGEGIDELIAICKETGVYVQVGYMMRYHPHAETIKKWIQDQTWGKLVSFSTHWGEHLPDWHPWEDYRESYAARKELGGGAALTLSHDLDLVLWMIESTLVSHHLIQNFASGLEVNVDSAADFLLGFENGVTGHVHLNFFQKVPRREYRFEFTEASVCFDFFKHLIEVKTKGNVETITMENFERNDLFLRQTIGFFRNMESFSIEQSIQNIQDAARVTQLCDPS